MRKYNYFFLKESVPADVVGLTNVITDLRARETIRRQQYAKTYDVLKQRAVIQSVKESNAIEGIVTTDDRIRQIVAGQVPVTHDEKEIAGYKDALNLIHTQQPPLDITEDVILQLHRMLMEGTAGEEAGSYKNNNNLILEYRADGTTRIRFRPIAASETAFAMEQMILAYYAARQEAVISPLLLIPCVIQDFLCIHPFTDGNGRISRLMTIMMLYLAGYDIQRYVSFEAQIKRYLDGYYDALEQSSFHWHDNENDYTPAMIFFLQILYRCFREVDEHFTELSLKKAKKSERVEAVVRNAIVPLSKADILERLPDISVKTVELTLSKLLKNGSIRKIGTYKDARYQSMK